MADVDFRGEAVAVVRVGWWHHPSVSFGPTPAANPGYRDNAGMGARQRSPRLARPRMRAIFVEAPVSSMNTRVLRIEIRLTVEPRPAPRGDV